MKQCTTIEVESLNFKFNYNNLNCFNVTQAHKLHPLPPLNNSSHSAINLIITCNMILIECKGFIMLLCSKEPPTV